MQPGLQATRSVRMTLLGILGQFHTDARRVGNDKVPIFEFQGRLDDLALGRFMLASRVFLQSEIGDTGRKLNAGGGAHRAKRVVRHHLDIVGLRQRRDLLAIRQTRPPCKRPDECTARRRVSTALGTAAL